MNRSFICLKIEGKYLYLNRYTADIWQLSNPSFYLGNVADWHYSNREEDWKSDIPEPLRRKKIREAVNMYLLSSEGKRVKMSDLPQEYQLFCKTFNL